MTQLPLAGTRVVTTRDEPGEVDRLLAAAGATVVHVALIRIVDTADGGVELDRHLARLGEFDWLVVTSRHGAARVGKAARDHPARLAAVGTATAGRLAQLSGRPVDVVPPVQTAAGLLAAMPGTGAGERVLLAQADRAGSELLDGLRHRGYEVTPVVAYRTVNRRPSASEIDAALAADAVAFASGSAVSAWIDVIGTRTPRCVVAIGPATAAVAREAGLTVGHVAADHTVKGLVDEVVRALAAAP